MQDYFAVMIHLNYDQKIEEKAKTFFACLYFELTNNFGFNFCDRMFYRLDSKSSICSLLKAALNVIAIQQHLSKEDVNLIIKHIFIIPLNQFEDVRQIINE